MTTDAPLNPDDDDDAAAVVDVVTDEFVERCRRGEYPSVTEYVRRYPEHADELQELLPAVAMMEQFKRREESQIVALEKRPDISGLQQLGDFRIVREIGHGGMGVVYEAVQESLGRRVALKVLSPATLGSGRSVDRFRREAETVARLHHTNIVPVFGFGEEKGLHYYVMQLIDGEPLNDVVEVLRSRSRFRSTIRQEQGSTLDDLRPDSNASESRHSSGSGSRFGSAPDGSGADGSGRSALIRKSDDSLAETVARPAQSNSDRETQDDSVGDSDTLHGQLKLHSVCHDNHTEVADASSTGSAADQRASIAAKATALEHYFSGDHWQAVAKIGVQVARALAYAHASGVWHRDIKPSNLLMDRAGTVWIVDFGLARQAEGSDFTQTGDLLGTLRYMSPEQLTGEFDHRSDIYSLGLTLYELLTFRPAHDASIRSRMMQQINESQPKSPREINPAIPRDLETVIIKATSHNAADRYQTAAALADDLQRFVDGFPILARRTSLLERFARWSRRNPALAATTATTLILLITVAGLSTYGYFAARRTNRDLQDSQWATDQARLDAEQQSQRAEGNLTLALKAFDAIVERVSMRGVPQSLQFADDDSGSSDETGGEAASDVGTALPAAYVVPTVTPADAELLQQLLDFYTDFATQNESSPQLAASSARVQRRIGDIRQRLGEYDAAVEAYSQALDRYHVVIDQNRLSAPAADRAPVFDRAPVSELTVSGLAASEQTAATGSVSSRGVSTRGSTKQPAGLTTTDAQREAAEVLNEIGLAEVKRGNFIEAKIAHLEARNRLLALPEDVQQEPKTRLLHAQTLNWICAIHDRNLFGGGPVGQGGPGLGGPGRPGGFSGRGPDFGGPGFDRQDFAGPDFAGPDFAGPDFAGPDFAGPGGPGQIGFDGDARRRGAPGRGGPSHGGPGSGLWRGDAGREESARGATDSKDFGRDQPGWQKDWFERFVAQARFRRGDLDAEGDTLDGRRESSAPRDGASRGNRRPPDGQRPPRNGAFHEGPGSDMQRLMAELVNRLATRRQLSGSDAFESRDPGSFQDAPDGASPDEFLSEFSFEPLRQQARAILKTLVREEPDNPTYQLELARSYQMRIRTRSRFDDRGGTLEEFDESIRLLDGLVERFPNEAQYRFVLADTLALSSPEMDREESPQHTQERFERSIELARGLFNRFPNVPEYASLLASSLQRLSQLLSRTGHDDIATEPLDESVATLRKLVSDWPEQTVYRLSLARSLKDSGMLARRSGDQAAADASFEEGVQVLKAVSVPESSPVPNPVMGFVGRTLGDLYWELGRLDEAFELFERYRPLDNHRDRDRQPGPRPGQEGRAPDDRQERRESLPHREVRPAVPGDE